MQVCRKIALSFAVCALSFAWADSPAMPSSPSMPEMPSVSIPTLSNSFYSPGFNTTKTKKSSGNQNASAKAQQSSADESSLADASSVSPAAIELSATDISSLGNMGLLGNLKSSSLYSSQSSSTTTALLQQILSELADLKKQVAATQAALKSQNIITTAEDSSSAAEDSAAGASANIERTENTVPRSAASLLRFTVNGYSLISTCRTLYVSDQQPDGSFLVTGDRRYISNGAFFNETFYFLFRPSGAKNGTETYNVAVSVAQGTPNPYSYVYRLSERQGLTASRTGNLVTLTDSAEKWRVDLLLDIGE